MAKAAQVLDGEGGGAAMIELDVGDAGRLVVARDGYGGNVEPGSERRVDGDEALDRPAQQKLLIAFDQLGAMMMGDDEVEEVRLKQPLLDAGQDQGCVAFGDLRHHDAKGEGASTAQGARQDVGAIVEETSRGDDFLLGGVGDGPGCRSA